MPVIEPSTGATGWNTWGHDITTVVNAVENAPARLDALEATAASYTDEQVRDVIGAALVAGSNVTITVNDGANTITIAASGGGGSGYVTVQDEGSALTQRTAVNFTGRGVAAVDNSGNSRTDVTIPDIPAVHAMGNSGTAMTVDASASAGYVKTITLTGNCTFTITGAVAGQASTLELVLAQDGTGSRTVTWPAAVKWAGGAPTLSTTAGAVDRVVLTSYNAGTTWYADLVGKGYA